MRFSIQTGANAMDILYRFCIQHAVNIMEMKDSRSGSRGPYHWGGGGATGPGTGIILIFIYIYIYRYLYIYIYIYIERYIYVQREREREREREIYIYIGWSSPEANCILFVWIWRMLIVHCVLECFMLFSETVRSVKVAMSGRINLTFVRAEKW